MQNFNPSLRTLIRISKVKFTLILFALLTTQQIASGQITFRGSIFDKATNEPLPGANVIVENAFLSTVSDANGMFSLRFQKSGAYPIKVTFLGYKSFIQNLTLRADTSITILLEQTALLGEEVNIVATRAGNKTPTTFSTLNAKEIEAINTGRDMPYLLQSTPSVVTSSDAGTGIGYTSIAIRGTDLTRINVTMNGIPINDAESQGVWFVDLPDLASSTQNIQIQRGVGTSTNGPGAFGASINIQTLTEKEKPFASLDLSGGSFGTLKSTFNFGSGMVHDHFAFDGRISYITSDGYIDRASANLKSFALSGGYFGKNTTLKINILSGHEKTYQAWEGVPKDSLETNRTYNPAGEYIDSTGQIAYYPNQTDNYTQSHYQLLFSQKVGDRFNFNAGLFYTKGYGYYENYKQDQSFAEYGLADVIIGSDTISSTNLINQKWLNNDFYGVTFSGNYTDMKRLNVTIGGAWSRYYGEHYGKIIWAQYASNGDNQRNWYYNTGDKSDFNIFAKATYQVTFMLGLFADLQYRRVDYLLNGDLDNLAPIDQNHLYNFFNPKGGVMLDLNNNHLYASVAVGHREPNRNNFEVADSSYMPQPEQLVDYEVGYDYKSTNFSAGACVYYMDYYDQLVLTGKLNNVGEAIMTNVPRSYRVGIELTAAANLFKWWKWNFNSTFSSNKIKNFIEYVDVYDADWNYIGQDQNELGTTTISFSPNLVLNNSFTFLPINNVSIALNSKLVGRQYVDNTSNIDRSLDPYFVTGILARYNWHPKPFKEIAFSAQVNNIFSTAYETNAWVYTYQLAGQEQSMMGYYPQAFINVLFGISISL